MENAADRRTRYDAVNSQIHARLAAAIEHEAQVGLCCHDLGTLFAECRDQELWKAGDFGSYAAWLRLEHHLEEAQADKYIKVAARVDRGLAGRCRFVFNGLVEVGRAPPELHEALGELSAGGATADRLNLARVAGTALLQKLRADRKDRRGDAEKVHEAVALMLLVGAGDAAAPPPAPPQSPARTLRSVERRLDRMLRELRELPPSQGDESPQLRQVARKAEEVAELLRRQGLGRSESSPHPSPPPMGEGAGAERAVGAEVVGAGVVGAGVAAAGGATDVGSAPPDDPGDPDDLDDHHPAWDDRMVAQMLALVEPPPRDDTDDADDADAAGIEPYYPPEFRPQPPPPPPPQPDERPRAWDEDLVLSCDLDPDFRARRRRLDDGTASEADYLKEGLAALLRIPGATPFSPPLPDP